MNLIKIAQKKSEKRYTASSHFHDRGQVSPYPDRTRLVNKSLESMNLRKKHEACIQINLNLPH